MKQHYDCIILGFGTAGSIAAIAAGRRGLSVLVLERGTCPGGTHTAGGIHCYYMQKPVGLMAELDQLCAGKNRTHAYGEDFSELRKFVLEEEARNVGAEIRYDTVVFDSKTENRRLQSVVWMEGDRECSAEGRIFIDATGDAFFCEMLGLPLHSGRASDGQFQPFTNTMLTVEGSKVGIRNFDAGRIDPYCEPQYTRTLLESSLVHLCDDFSLRRDMLCPAALPGIREGKHLKNGREYTLEEFFRTHGTCAEPVFYAYTNIDTHANDIALESNLFGEWMILCSMWGFNLGFPVPRQVLSAAGAGVRNLLIAGRHLAADHDLAHALRMNALMGALGECAGILASYAVKYRKDPDDIPYAAFKNELPLDPSVLSENKRIWMTDESEIRAGLDSNRPGFAQWSARENLSDRILVQWMNQAEQGSELRRHSALVLAMKRNPAGLSELCQMVRERDPYTPVHSRKYNHPRGYAALFALGLLTEPETGALMKETLLSGETPFAYEYQTHAIAALVKLGDRHPALRPEIADALKLRAEDPAWRIESRLKGTKGTLKRMDPVFRCFIGSVLKRWGIRNRIGEVLRGMPLDAYETMLSERSL